MLGEFQPRVSPFGRLILLNSPKNQYPAKYAGPDMHIDIQLCSVQDIMFSPR